MMLAIEEKLMGEQAKSYRLVILPVPYEWNPDERTLYAFNSENKELLKEMFSLDHLLDLLGCMEPTLMRVADLSNFFGTEGEELFALTGDDSLYKKEKEKGVNHRYISEKEIRNADEMSGETAEKLEEYRRLNPRR